MIEELTRDMNRNYDMLELCIDSIFRYRLMNKIKEMR
jgi:hypothetical protein